VTVQIDFERINQRTLALPLPARNYRRLLTGKDGVLFVVEGAVAPALNGPETLSAWRFDLNTRKTEKLVEGITSFEVSDNGEKMLYRQIPPGAATVAEGGEQPPAQWTIAPAIPAAAAAPGGLVTAGQRCSRRCRKARSADVEAGRHGSPRRSDRRMETDVPRSVPPGARLLLRSGIPRLRSQGG
jgi:hypothetical protein